MVEKKWKGNFTVEAAILASALLFIVYGIIMALFYYHDKNILLGAAAETAVLAAQTERQQGQEGPDLQSFYRERTAGKLIWLKLTVVEVDLDDKWVSITARAGKGRMRVQAVQKTKIPEPEKKIRKKRLLESLTEQEE